MSRGTTAHRSKRQQRHSPVAACLFAPSTCRRRRRQSRPAAAAQVGFVTVADNLRCCDGPPNRHREPAREYRDQPTSLKKKKITSFGQPTSLIARGRASATLPNVIHLCQLNVSDLQIEMPCQHHMPVCLVSLVKCFQTVDERNYDVHRQNTRRKQRVPHCTCLRWRCTFVSSRTRCCLRLKWCNIQCHGVEALH